MGLRTFTSVGVVLALHGCGGGGGDKKTTGDTNAPGAGTSLVVAQSVPAKGATGVPIDTSFTVTFSQEIDPASISAPRAVRLLLADRTMADMPHADDPALEDPSMDTMPEVVGTANYNTAARQLTFTTTSHLEHGEDYHLVLSGLRTVSGGAIGAQVIDFRTLNNPEIRSVRYDTATGQITSTTVYTRNARGRTTREDRYNGTETTGTLTSYTLLDNPTIPGPPQTTVRSVTYDGASNQITGYSAEIKEGTTTFRVSYRDPGANLLWDQTDDLIRNYSTGRESHGNQHLITTTFSTTANPGAPWSQRSSAFQVSNVQLRELDAQMRTRRIVNYSSLGSANQVDTTPAGELTVIDDIVVSYELVTRDAQGRRLSTKSFGRRGRGNTPGTPPNPGLDGRLFTADDVPVEMEVATYNAMGHRTLEVEYNSPGLDGNWDTVNDNGVAEYDLYTFAPGTENRLERRSYEDGGNGIMENGAGDDRLERVETYDPNV